jgi:hypothetical protein
MSEGGLGRPEQVSRVVPSSTWAFSKCAHIYSFGTSDPYTPYFSCKLATHLGSPPFRTMVTLRLLNLPIELLITIFSNLPARSTFACAESCHRLRAVINESKLLEWRRWSTKHGIQELLPSDLSLPDFYANAQRWENDWFHFSVRNEVKTPSMYRPSQGSPRRESLCPTKNDLLMRSGYLIQMHEKENPGWSHMHLPSREFIQNPVWTNVRFGYRLAMEGWALDLDQDLVAASLLS